MIKSDNYPGSKFGAGSYQQIINLLPKHDIYIEGFLGSAAIMKLKKTAGVNIGYDVDSCLIDKARIFFQEAIHKNNDAADFQFYNRNFITFLDHASPFLNMAAAVEKKICMYLDPPYLFETRRSKAKIYKHEMTIDDHINLLSLVRNINCYVVISCYDSPLYQEMLPDWNKIQYQSKTRSGTATETLYYNFAGDITKNEYTYLGSNFRERAKIKAKVLRHVSSIMSMSDDERNWILSEVTSKLKILS